MEHIDTPGTIFNIQKFSVHDGPGVRTAVFFKGCNLACVWCHNPESISPRPQVEFYPDRCIGCGKCVEACPTGAQRFDPITGAHVVDRGLCEGCLSCAETCYAGALAGVGQTVTAGEVLARILDDKPYYDQSGGGVTFSGGECMMQPAFLHALLSLCREHKIHTAVDTAGNVSWKWFERILPLTDLFLVPTSRRRTAAPTGGSPAGETSLSWKTFPGYPNRAHPSSCASLLLKGTTTGRWRPSPGCWLRLPWQKVEILPYHKLGNSKYTALNLPNRAPLAQVPEPELLDRTVEAFRALGIPACHT